MKPEIESNRASTGLASTERPEILTGVKAIVAEQMGMDPQKIAESDVLEDDLGCDSLDMVEIAMNLEDHFDISIPEDFTDEVKTIGDVTDGVVRLRKTL